MFSLGEEEPSIAHICSPLQPSLPLNPSLVTLEPQKPGGYSFFLVECEGSEGSVAYQASHTKLISTVLC